MTATAKKVLAAAMRLRPGERVALAEELLGSEVETASAGEIESAWRAEVLRRAGALKNGAPRGDSWKLVEKRLRSRLNGRK